MVTSKTILSLCDYTGIWSEPYRKAGYNVWQLDLEFSEDQDVRLLKFDPSLKVYGILAAPPCTHLAFSGARWWKSKGLSAIVEGMAIADACLRAVVLYKPKFWVLENPKGRIQDYYGPPKFIFNPCDFAGASDDVLDESYTKETWLWGEFNIPDSEDLEYVPVLGSKMHTMIRCPRLRSKTPQGFARAFFEANR